VGLEPVEESTKIAQLHLSHDPEILPRVKYITGNGLLSLKPTLGHIQIVDVLHKDSTEIENICTVHFQNIYTCLNIVISRYCSIYVYKDSWRHIDTT